MPIEVTCPSCGGFFHAPDDAAGKRANCPTCGGVIQIGSGAPAAAPAADKATMPWQAPESAGGDVTEAAASSAAADGDQRRPCPMCGEMIQRDAIKCRFCGEIFDETIARAERARGTGSVYGESTAGMALRQQKEKQDRTSSILLFALSIFGCFSPILAVYGIIFLSNRRYPFQYKGLAIAGTVIHCFWAVIWILTLSAKFHR